MFTVSFPDQPKLFCLAFLVTSLDCPPSSPLHSIDFTEELLEEHEAEVAKVKKYLHDNRELFNKVCLDPTIIIIAGQCYTLFLDCGTLKSDPDTVQVAQRQEVWNKLKELERRAKVLNLAHVVHLHNLSPLSKQPCPTFPCRTPPAC